MDLISNAFQAIGKNKIAEIKILLNFLIAQPFQPSLISDQIQTTFKRSHM